MIKLKKIKKKKIKEQPLIQDDNYKFKNMIVIIAIIVIALIPLYFITKLVIGDKTTNSDVKTVEIEKDLILVNQLLNRPYNEYYVLAYKRNNKEISSFNSYIYDYENKKDSLKVYHIDLDDALNKSHIGSETNITDELKDLTISDTVLFKITDRQIDSYYVGNDEVLNYLKEING